MSNSKVRQNEGARRDDARLSDNLRDSKMMAHLMDALEQGIDIGHYGRLVFAMVARHFLSEQEMIDLLAGQPDMDDMEARALVLQVNARGYSPPKRARILEWREQQDFPICPNPDDPSGCNVYDELRFPEEVYERIDEYWEGKAEAAE